MARVKSTLTESLLYIITKFYCTAALKYADFSKARSVTATRQKQVYNKWRCECDQQSARPYFILTEASNR